MAAQPQTPSSSWKFEAEREPDTCSLLLLSGFHGSGNGLTSAMQGGSFRRSPDSPLILRAWCHRRRSSSLCYQRMCGDRTSSTINFSGAALPERKQFLHEDRRPVYGESAPSIHAKNFYLHATLGSSSRPAACTARRLGEDHPPSPQSAAFCRLRDGLRHS